MTSNQTYWLQRAERRIDNYTLAAFDVAKNIRRAYSSLQTYIESEMAKILRHVGGEDSLAYEYRMRRLAALLNNTEEKFKEVYGINLATTTAFLKEIVPEAYYHTIFDLAQGAGVQPEFAAIPDRLVNKIINENWSGKNYSKRIWANNKALEEEIRGLLTEAAVSGESIYKTSRKLSDKFNQSAYNSQRLVRTETTYATNQAELLSYEELDIDKYEFVATLDTRTSSICQKMDGKVFKTSDAQAGKNLPAMHPNCRSTTIPYFKEGMPTVRAARDKDGNLITVPADMKYDEWYKKYIEPYEGEKGTKKRTKPSKGKDTTPSQTTPQQPQEVPTIDVPAPSVGVPEYVEEKIPKKPIFTPAKTIEEAEQAVSKYVREPTWSKNGITSLKGLDLETANKFSETLSDIYEEFDLPLLENLKPMNFRESIWKDSQLAPMAYRNLGEGELYFNPKIMKNRKSLDKYHEEGKEAFEKCKNNLDRFTGKDRELVETYIKAGRSLIAEECEDTIKATIEHEIGHHIQNQIIELNKDMYETVSKGFEEYAIKISGYATKTKGEYIAESFSAYRNGHADLIDPEVKKIFDGLRRKS